MCAPHPPIRYSLSTAFRDALRPSRFISPELVLRPSIKGIRPMCIFVCLYSDATAAYKKSDHCSGDCLIPPETGAKMGRLVITEDSTSPGALSHNERSNS